MQTNPETALEVLKSKDAEIMPYLQNIAITSREQQKNYEDVLISARQSIQRAEAMRKELIEPIRLTEQRINAMFKAYTSPLVDGCNSIIKVLNHWRKEQSDISDAKLLTEAQEYWKRVNEAKETGEVVPLPELNSTPPPKTSHANLGSVSYREVFEIRVVSPDLVPRDLCEPSVGKIRKRAESGITSIEGVIITKKFVPYTRLYNQ
jgi:hypothetical protein